MQLGTLERSIMQALWEHPGGVFANHLAAILPSQPATTTVLTVLVRLSHKGMVARERIGRAHLYKATATKDAFAAEAACRPQRGRRPGGGRATLRRHRHPAGGGSLARSSR